MVIQDFIERANELIKKADMVLASRRTTDFGEYVDSGLYYEFRSSSLSFFTALYGESHPYYKEFDKHVDVERPDEVERGRGILRAARDEMAGGWLNSVRGIVSAELFADFLEMAGYLIAEGYKDASAVMVGSVLEEHLRQLCQKNKIDVTIEKDGKRVPRKADALNADLAGKSIYSKLDQKNITAWLDLRNKAAHGQYSEYNDVQVKLMHQAVGEFIARITV